LTTPVPALPAPYLRAVLAMPDDDGPRLCAADWWDERGAAERAEFVRVQCEIARRDVGGTTIALACPDDCRCYDCGGMARRERELLAGSRGKWFEFPITWYVGIDPVPVGAHGFQYRRGFFEVAALTAADFLAHADALTAACPLRRVALTTCPDLVVNGGYTYSLPGRPATRVRWGDESWDSLSLRLLKADFPGIDFEMLTVGFRPGSLSPSQVPLTTDDRRSPPRPSWSTRTY
jgi:uncharacterized protein (TIGR02996 family)